MNRVDEDIRKYYENQFDLFAHPGWRDLLEDLEELYKAVSDITTVENIETLYHRKGEMSILNLIFDRKNACEATWQDLFPNG